MAANMGMRAGLFALAGMLLSSAVATADPKSAVTSKSAELPAAVSPVVIEMFTAQGCAACPPADAIFNRFADTPGVIALALHVDYWDYLGWLDSFASPAYTERQKAYARAANAKMIYTPQVIVGGVDRTQGNRSAEIAALIAARAVEPNLVHLSAKRDGQSLLIEASAAAALGAETMVQLVRYRPLEEVSIEDGENAGHDMTYRNIVTDWQTVAAWDGAEPLSLSASLEQAISKDLPLVVIVQEKGPGPILAAAMLD